jgi:tetratricopeptide (TPR) repeat protein
MTLNNLAILYSGTQRIQKAEGAYEEALAAYRNLAEANPDAYLPNVAMTLNNLANLLLSNGRAEEADTHASEAEGILDPFWQARQELHGNQMARILSTRAQIFEVGNKTGEACALARRALAATYDQVIRQSIQKLIERICPTTRA